METTTDRFADQNVHQLRETARALISERQPHDATEIRREIRHAKRPGLVEIITDLENRADDEPIDARDIVRGYEADQPQPTNEPAAADARRETVVGAIRDELTRPAGSTSEIDNVIGQLRDAGAHEPTAPLPCGCIGGHAESCPEAETKPAKPRGQRSRTTVADLLIAGLLDDGQRLYGTYRGQTVACYAEAADGTLVANHQSTTSPSAAVKQAIVETFGEGPRLVPGGSGWTFWRTEAGERLGDLRDRLTAGE